MGRKENRKRSEVNQWNEDPVEEEDKLNKEGKKRRYGTKADEVNPGEDESVVNLVINKVSEEKESLVDQEAMENLVGSETEDFRSNEVIDLMDDTATKKKKLEEPEISLVKEDDGNSSWQNNRDCKA